MIAYFGMEFSIDSAEMIAIQKWLKVHGIHTMADPYPDVCESAAVWVAWIDSEHHDGMAIDCRAATELGAIKCLAELLGIQLWEGCQ